MKWKSNKTKPSTTYFVIANHVNMYNSKTHFISQRSSRVSVSNCRSSRPCNLKLESTSSAITPNGDITSSSLSNVRYRGFINQPLISSKSIIDKVQDIKYLDANTMDSFTNLEDNIPHLHNRYTQTIKTNDDDDIFNITPEDLEEVDKLEKERKQIEILREAFDEDFAREKEELETFVKSSHKDFLNKLSEKGIDINLPEGNTDDIDQ